MHTILTLFVTSTLMNPFAGTALPDEPPASTPVSEHHAAMEQAPEDDEEILWLARTLYSETKREDEMRLVAWVVRNRVETKFRGTTYKEVALSHKQFSGLNKGDKQYAHNISLTFEHTYTSWQTAVRVAREVYYAPASERPLPTTVRHFYSPIAVRMAPGWSTEGTLYHSTTSEHGTRFAFYEGVR